MDLTIEECKHLHKELWHWLSKNPGCIKSDWPRWTRNNGDIGIVLNWCFACEYSLSLSDNMCSVCPIQAKSGRCGDDNSTFAQWEELLYTGDDPDNYALTLAETIRDAWEED